MAPLTEFVIGTKVLLNGFRVRQQTPPFVIPAKGDRCITTGAEARIR